MSLISIANASDVAAAPVMTTGTSLMSLLPMILIFVIFYFFLIRPQVKKQKLIENMINELKKGDQVIAAGGLCGTVSKIDGNILYLEIADNIKVKILKSSVTEVVSSADNVKSEPEVIAPAPKVSTKTKEAAKTKKATPKKTK